MKNILLIMPYGSVGGMERLALTFYDFYKSQGHNVKAVKIIGLPSDIIHFGEDEYVLSRKDFNRFSFQKRLLFYIRIPGLLRKIIKKENITHSIAFGDMSNTFSSLTFTSEFKVASIHSLKSVEFVHKTFLNRIFKLSYRTSYRNFDKVVNISEASKADLVEKCGFKFVDKMQVIYNPHNIPLINKMAEEPFDRAAETAIFSKPVIIFVGRLSREKSPWHLIKSYALLLEKRGDVNLVFIGDGDKNIEKYCHELIAELGIGRSVFFFGRRTNPYKYIKKSKLLALSSFYEGTPNVIVEAIGLGIPVVSSLCTEGIVELMSITEKQYAGKNIFTETGIITPTFFEGKLSIPTDNNFTEAERQMAQALYEVLDSNRFEASIAANKEMILNKFDLKSAAINYLLPLKAANGSQTI